MKQFLLLAVLALSTLACAQSGIVEQARAKNEAAHRRAMIFKAQHLLAEKASLEAQLKTVDEKLEKLNRGEDVKDFAWDGLEWGAQVLHPLYQDCTCANYCTCPPPY
jgi:cytochrome c biogenesis protein ResB